jgi:2-(1,2-epoxy-1,2-dihydrophenyl)acetyl-CoA isomerase
MAYESILYEQKDGVLTITLNRPDKLNALTDKMLGELNDAFKVSDKDTSIRVIVLTGAGRGFCPGQDLGEAQQHQGTDGHISFGAHLRATYNPLILKMRQHSKPIIAAINGVAAGAGMSLAMACDLRVACESSSFLQAFVKIGLIPDSGSTWMLPRLVGRTKALELMLTGKKITSQEALEIGLVNLVIPDAELMSTVNEMAAAFASAPTRAIAYIKRSVEFAATSTLEAALENEADLQELAGRTEDYHEGLAAFLEKRTTQFKGQ